MIRCTRCIYPDTRPDANFVDGVCSACRSFDERKSIDWGQRSEVLDDILARAFSEAAGRNSPYDVVVPVSGGKDSTWQMITLLKAGMRVLGVNAGTDMLSDIGRRNLDNLKAMIDIVEYVPSYHVRKKLIRIGLREVGDMSWPEHCAIWSIPTRIAQMFNVPLVVWGEQPQREYATPSGVQPATVLDGKWVAEFGGMLGLRVSDLVGVDGLDERDLRAFEFPDLDGSTKGIWLGDYLEWDGWKNAFVAQQYGFEVLPTPVEGSLANYENLDNHVTVLRDWLRFLKYGYSRATDIACNHIRRGRLSRDEALFMLSVHERFPLTSLGKPVSHVLAWCGIHPDEFVKQCDRWTNPDIFQFGSDGLPQKDADGTPRFRAED